MNHYLVRLSLRSGLGTPLAADTLWGCIAWGMRYSRGDAALQKWLDQYASDQPPLIVSDPMPHGWLPRPRVPALPVASNTGSDDEDSRKRQRKAQWITTTAWSSIAPNLSPTTLAKHLMHTHTPSEPVVVSVLHAGINRLTGGTAQAGGGTLYAVEQTFYDSEPGVHALFDVVVVSPSPIDEVKRWFADGLVAGYGRDSQTGSGWLVLEDINMWQPQTIASANAGMLLGLATPTPRDPHRGFFNFGVRAGRLGGDFAIGATPNGSTQRQKRPFYCLLRGSVIIAERVPAYLGQLLTNVHEDPAIRHYALSPVLPCRLDQHTFQEAMQ